MQTFHGYSGLPPHVRRAALAIGNFDGVHRGHQALVGAAREAAAKAAAASGVILFEPHPREFFQPDRPHFRITPIARKLELLAGLGLDLALVLPFDAALARMTADEFIARVLVEAIGIGHAIVGYDFHFGRDRGGNTALLAEAGRRHGFAVTVVEPVAAGGEVFSSSAIRAELAQGDVLGAAISLGHWWRVAGTVIGGAHRGTGMGYPTANIDMPPGTALAHGIYAVRVIVGGEAHDGAAYLGTRPTFDGGKPKLEAFLFDFDGNLYGREIAVELIGYIRGDRRFADAEAVKAQMDADCAEARRLLAAAGPKPPAA